MYCHHLKESVSTDNSDRYQQGMNDHALECRMDDQGFIYSCHCLRDLKRQCWFLNQVTHRSNIMPQPGHLHDGGTGFPMSRFEVPRCRRLLMHNQQSDKMDFNWRHVQVQCLTACQLIAPQFQQYTQTRMTYAVNIF